MAADDLRGRAGRAPTFTARSSSPTLPRRIRAWRASAPTSVENVADRHACLPRSTRPLTVTPRQTTRLRRTLLRRWRVPARHDRRGPGRSGTLRRARTWRSTASIARCDGQEQMLLAEIPAGGDSTASTDTGRDPCASGTPTPSRRWDARVQNESGQTTARKW